MTASVPRRNGEVVGMGRCLGAATVEMPEANECVVCVRPRVKSEMGEAGRGSQSHLERSREYEPRSFITVAILICLNNFVSVSSGGRDSGLAFRFVSYDDNKHCIRGRAGSYH